MIKRRTQSMSQKIQYLREGKITSELKTGELILDTLTVMRELGGWGILYSRSLVLFYFLCSSLCMLIPN